MSDRPSEPQCIVYLRDGNSFSFGEAVSPATLSDVLANPDSLYVGKDFASNQLVFIPSRQISAVVVKAQPEPESPTTPRRTRGK